MNIKTLLLAAGLVAIVFGTAGCAAVVVGGAAAAGAGTYAYISGELKSTESASLDKAWSASQAAMKDLEFSVITHHKDALQAELTARNSADKKITVKLKKITDSAIEVRIRVGTFGDEHISRAILEKIKKRL